MRNFLLIAVIAALGASAVAGPLDVLGGKQTFQVDIADRTLGTVECTYSTAESDDAAYCVTCVLNFDYGAMATPPKNDPAQRLTMNSDLDVTASGDSVRYTLHVEMAAATQALTCKVDGREVHCRLVKGEHTQEKTIQYPEGQAPLILDNNMIGQWALLAAIGGWGDGEARTLDAFVPQSLGRQRYELKPLPAESLEQYGEEPLVRYEVQPLQETFWLTQAGKLVRIEEPRQKMTIRDVTGR